MPRYCISSRQLMLAKMSGRVGGRAPIETEFSCGFMYIAYIIQAICETLLIKCTQGTKLGTYCTKL